MSPKYVKALKTVMSAHHVLWSEVETPVRHIYCDLFLDGLLDLGYLNDAPYVFTINENGRRAVQAAELEHA